MDFDRFTFLILSRPDGAPDVSAAEADRIQDAHLAHLSAMHDAGQLAAAGPLAGQHDDTIRGFGIFTTDIATAKTLMAQDPAVVAGRLEAHVMTWFVPAGAVHFSPTHFPVSIAEATG
jgi:uncharacterized protein YciI